MTTSLSSPQTRVTRNDGYGRSSRFYDVEDKRLPSVTTILQAVNKPALVNWAAKTEREMVITAAADLYEDLPLAAPRMKRMAYLSTLQGRLGTTKAHAKELQKAADIGSAAHAKIEWTLRRDMGQMVGPEPVLSEKALWAFMAWEDWRKAANLSVALVEQTVYSVQHGYAGTMDWTGEIDHEGQRLQVLGDWKTSKGIWPEMLLQNAAYVHALIEMGQATPPISGCLVRLPKVETDPAFEVRIIPADTQRALLKVFLATLDLWKWLDAQ